MTRISRALLVCLVAWSLTSAQEASAATVQQVQSGTAVSSANGIQTIAISSIDPTKSFLIFETRSDSNRPVGSTVRGRLASATTLEFERVTNGAAPEPAPINIQWYVVTFGAGVKVQRGEAVQSSPTINVAITAVASLSQAFVLWSKTPFSSDSEWGSDDHSLAELTSTTNLQLRADAANANMIVSWQVVEFTDAADINVQKGSITSMTGTTTSVTAALSPVDVSKTFVLVGWRTSGGGTTIGTRMLRARLTNSTTVTIDRSVSGDDITEIVWQAIELKDASTVLGGTTNFPAGTSTAAVSLPSMMNARRAVAFGSAQSGSGQNMGRSPYVADDVIGVGAFTAGLGIGYRSAASGSAGSGALTLTVNKPAGTAEFDVMVASIAFRPETAVVTPPAGWTLVRRVDNGNATGNSLAIYWKAADTTEPASYNWTLNTSTGSTGSILTFINVDNANPIDVENGQNTAYDVTHSAPSVTTTAADEMIVTTHAFSSGATWTPPAGMTELVDISSETVPNCCGMSLEVNFAAQPAAGATGVLTATASNDGDVGNTHTLALRPTSSAKYLTLTRNNTAADADLGWFVVEFDEGPGFKVGSFTKSTAGAPTTQTIAHGLGSVPKAIILWTDGRTNESMGTSFLYGFGMTDGTTSRSVAAASQGAVGTSNASTRMAGKALTIVQWGETLVAEADLLSWDETSFRLRWTTNNSTAYVIHYIVIGGPDVSAKVVEWTMGTGTGNRSVTGVGFQPNAVIHAHGTQAFTAALPANIAGAGFGLGVMDADGDQWASTIYSVDASGTSDTQRGQQTDSAIYAFNNALAVQKEASWVSMDADGFTMRFTNSTSTANAQVLSLALKGVNVKAGRFLKATGGAPASQTVSGVGFQPNVVMLASVQDITRAAPVAHGRLGLGASDGSTQGASAITDTNGQNTSVVNAIDKTSKAFVKVDSNAAVNAEANLTSLNADGFTLNWTTNDAVQTEMLYLALAPMSLTEVRLTSFDATRYDRGVLLQWTTGYEIDNLGFHVYREIAGVKTRVTSALVAGSGLTLGPGTPSNGERNYAFWDLDAAAADETAAYWLEDVDLNGHSTWHGPVSPVAGGVNMPPVQTSNALGSDPCRVQAPTTSVSIPCNSGDAPSAFLEAGAGGGAVDFVRPQPQDPLQVQWTLAAGSSIRLAVRRPGWYRVTQPELLAAGLRPAADPRALRLFADGVEQAISVIGESDGRLDATDAVEFFATGVDTPYTDTRIYWLTESPGAGRRLPVSSVPVGTPSGESFWHTLRVKARTTYFAALRNGDVENWFGDLVSDAEPAVVTMRISHIDPGSRPAELDLALQGVTIGDADNHRVAVSVNGHPIQDVSFSAQERPVFRLELPAGVLQDGDNEISLIALGGEDDFSLVDYVDIGYWHTPRADADELLFNAQGQQSVRISGFSSSSIHVVDITDPSAAIRVPATVQADDGLYAVVLAAPGAGQRQLFAFTDPTVAHPQGVRANVPSSWHESGNAFDYLVLTRREFAGALQPLVTLREQQGYHGAIVDIEDVYDEFSFGEKTPAAIRRFLNRATAAWSRRPRFVVLGGDATQDPRDYAGNGDFDLVPTKLLSMASVALETASDEWLVDFNDDGLPEIAVGRLPFRSEAQAEAMAAKIVAYETQAPGAWTKDVTFVADENDATDDFEATSRSLAAALPSAYRAHEVFSGSLGAGTAAQITTEVAKGRLMVSYVGHGSTQLWGRHGDLLTPDAVRSDWTGGSRLPFVMAMNCLNGFFHGIYGEESLAETLLRTPAGGAVAAWASSGLTSSATQRIVSRELFRLLFTDGTLTLGEAAARAKQVIGQRDVRRSWIFFGDPATRLAGVEQGSSTDGAGSPSSSTGSSNASNADSSAPTDGAMAAGIVRRLRLADFDGDGRADLFVYRPETGDWQIWSAAGQFLRGGLWLPGLDVQAADFNGDRLADLFLYERFSGAWFELVNGRDGFTAATGVSLSNADVHIGDLDGNGLDDVFLYQPASGFWSKSAGDGERQAFTTSGRWTPGLVVRIADFDGDGFDDILAYDGASGSLRLWLGNWTGVASEAATYRNQDVLVGRLDADSRADLLLYDRVSGHWETWVSPAPGHFVVGATGTWAPGLAPQLVDLTGDGLDEAVLYEPIGGSWAVASMTGGAGPTTTGIAPAGATLASGDIDGDGAAELYLYQAETGAVQLLDGGPGAALQSLSAIWPGGWSVQGYPAGEPVEFTSALDVPADSALGPSASSINADDALDALRMLGLQRVPPQTGSSTSSAASRSEASVVTTSVAAPVVPPQQSLAAGIAQPAPAGTSAKSQSPATGSVQSGPARRGSAAASASYAPTYLPSSTTAASDAPRPKPMAAPPAETEPPVDPGPPAGAEPAAEPQALLDPAPEPGRRVSPEPAADDEARPAHPSRVMTDLATDVTGDSAILHGSIPQHGADVIVGFLWDPMNPPKTATPLQTFGTDGGDTADAAVTGLSPDTVYYFRIFVEDARGRRVLGPIQRFRTASPAAEAGTGNVAPSSPGRP